jgi:hypothetical protein
MEATQTYDTHRRWVPYFHFFALPVLALNVLVQIYFLYRHFSPWGVWNLLVAVALAALPVAIRSMVTRAQDRIIRLEETLRLQRCLSPEMRGRIGELTTGQLIALRFCSDEEVPELVGAVFGGELKSREDIKRRIKNWRPDNLRV